MKSVTPAGGAFGGNLAQQAGMGGFTGAFLRGDIGSMFRRPPNPVGMSASRFSGGPQGAMVPMSSSQSSPFMSTGPTYGAGMNVMAGTNQQMTPFLG